MGVNPYVLVILGALAAATGQIFFKLGATGSSALMDFVNVRIITGLCLYGASTIMWIAALSKLPLSRVYPFTVLTFVIVYIASFIVLREQLTMPLLFGALLVLAGLIVITVS